MDLKKEYRNIVGHEKKLLEFISSLVNTSNFETENLNFKDIIYHCPELKNKNQICELIHRLNKKQLLKTIYIKPGPNSIRRFSISQEVFNFFKNTSELKVVNKPKKEKNNLVEVKPLNGNPIKLEKISNIYFIVNKDFTKCKIGESQDVDKRLKQHQTGNPDKLVIYRVLQNIPVSFEKEIHERFSHLRLEGEWFKMTEELKNYIDYLEIPQFVKNLILKAQNE